jgi:lipoprotein-releasing system permease protein
VQQAQTVAFWIVDASRTQIWQYDSNTVYVPFKVAQRFLKMDEVRDEDGKVEEPARTSDIQVKVKSGVDLQKAKAAIAEAVQRVRTLHQIPRSYPILVQTWEESQALWLDAIENEKSLVTFLFSLISIVAIFLIFCIFYMIVVEKTKDIGIIKSVGATNAGVAGIFLGYGLAIGIAGAGAGLLFGYLIIHNINYLHTELGRRLGIVIWKPEVYAFDIIPNTMNPKEVAVIVLVAIVSSLLGALIPAWRAARMHPVEALRWE